VSLEKDIISGEYSSTRIKNAFVKRFSSVLRLPSAYVKRFKYRDYVVMLELEDGALVIRPVDSYEARKLAKAMERAYHKYRLLISVSDRHNPFFQYLSRNSVPVRVKTFMRKRSTSSKRRPTFRSFRV